MMETTRRLDPVQPLTAALVQAIVLSTDLHRSARTMEELGFSVQEGGSHPGRGTSNLVISFGSQYLEILAVVDAQQAGESPLGKPVLAALAGRGPGLCRWAVEPPDLAATARRLQIPVERRSRVRPDGTEVTWRAVGVDQAWARPWLPGFLAWDDPERHPARISVSHPNGATGFELLEVGAPDPEEVLRWVGGRAPDVARIFTTPPHGPQRLLISTSTGPVEIC